MNTPRCLLVSSLALVALGLASFAAPHHFKGMPHFSYFENYPQVPQDEYLGRIGHFETSLMIYDFQGITKLDAEQPDDVRMYLVLFDLLKNETYKGPLTLRVMDGDTPLAEKAFEHSEEESLYAFTKRMPLDGDFLGHRIQTRGIRAFQPRSPLEILTESTNSAAFSSGNLGRNSRIPRDRLL